METLVFLSDLGSQDTETLKIALRQIAVELQERDLANYVNELHIKLTGEQRANKAEAKADLEAKIKSAETKAAEEAAAQKLAEQWEIKRVQSALLLEAVEDCSDVYFQVWQRAGEKRVYVQDGPPFGKRTVDIACLYVTGNSKNRPGSMEIKSYKKVSNEELLKSAMEQIGKRWKEVKVSVNEAIS